MSQSVTKKKQPFQKEQQLLYLDEDVLVISDEEDIEIEIDTVTKPDLSYLNQPTLIVVKNRKRRRKKYVWAVPL